MKIQCQVSSEERTALAANSINCNPWNNQKKRKNVQVYYLYIYIERGTGKENEGVYI